MKINVSYNTKSLENAIKILKQAKKDLKGKMISEFLVECCKVIKNLANDRLELLDIGSNVKLDIESHWEIGKVVDNKITLTNSSDKAVYVEFGVGIVGASKKHPKATIEGYEYNVKSASKLPDDSWMFSTTIEDLDLPQKDVYAYNGKNNELVIETKGTPATMFVYQSIIDFKDRRLAQGIWQNIKAKYWG